MRYLKILTLLSLISITVVRCFYFDVHKPLEKWDEQTNIQVISESATARGRTYLLYQNRPFFEKPPVWYVITIFLHTVSRIPLIPMARIFSALCGFAVIALVFIFSYRRYGYGAAILTWIILITTNQLFTTNPHHIFSTHTFRTADSDALFILLILVSSISALRMHSSLFFSVCTGIFTGVAVLTKSPLAFIPLIIETYMYTTRDHRQKKYAHILVAWVISFFVLGIWFIPMTIIFKGPFINEYVGYHLVLRAITAIEHHREPLLFYVSLLFTKQIFLFMEIYILAIIIFIRTPVLQKDRTLLHLCVTSLCLLMFPTITQTKLSWYILPFYPFAALSIAGVASALLPFQYIFRKKHIIKL